MFIASKLTDRKDIEVFCEEYERILLADGFDAAFIGVGTQFSNEPVAVYDLKKCLKILEEDGMTYDEAVEFFDYNVQGSWVGKQTPMFVDTLEHL